MVNERIERLRRVSLAASRLTKVTLYAIRFWTGS